MAIESTPEGYTYPTTDAEAGTAEISRANAYNSDAKLKYFKSLTGQAQADASAALATLGAVKQESTAAKTAAQQSASSAVAAQNAATDAEGTVERFGDDVELLKQMAEITPGSVTDAQTAILIQDPESETHTRLNAQTDEWGAVNVPPLVAESIAADPTVAHAAASAVNAFVPDAVSAVVGSLRTPNLDAVSYGDSITWAGGYQPLVVARLSLMSYVNRGVSGRPMADGTANGAGTVTTVLAKSDHSDFDLVTIAAGTNDFRLNVPIGTLGAWADATLARNTFLGAYRTTLDHILAENPEARIVLCTPLKRSNAGYTDESTNTAGHMLRDYAQAVRDVASMYGLPVCDWYADSGFNHRTLSTFTTDGLHPNDTGNARLGRFMGDYIGSILGIAPPRVPQTIAADAFDREDSTTTLGTADTGQTWAVLTGNGATWGIAGGNAYQSTAGAGFAALDSGSMDVRVKATLGATGTVSGGIGAWITDADNGLYLITTTSSYLLARRSAGGNTNIVTSAAAPAVGDVVELVTAGTKVQAYVNGVMFGEHPNLTAPPRATRVGLWGTGTTSPRWADFEVLA